MKIIKINKETLIILSNLIINYHIYILNFRRNKIMAIAEIKWKLVKDTYVFDTTTCYLSENGNHLFYVGKEKQIEILINNLNELVRKGCAMWLKLGEYEFGLDKLSKCPTQAWYSIHQKLYSLEAWGVIKESKKYTTKSIKEYNYDSHNKSWVSDSVEKIYTNGLGYKNDWCTLSLYKDEYENLVNYLLDEKGFILEKKYTKKLGYDIFINEKLDLYVVIINETTYGFFDEKHFIIKFGDELGIETPIEFVEKTLKGVLFETFNLTKNDVDLIKSNVDYIILKTKESMDKKLLDNVLNDELSEYHYPISVEVEEGKDESICIIWVS